MVAHAGGADGAASGLGEKATRIVQELREAFRARVRVFVGRPTSRISELTTSLSAALLARSHSSIGGGPPVQPAEETAAPSPHLYYPINVETQLIAATLAGDRERVSSLIVNVLQENFDRRHLSEQESAWLSAELKGTAVRILEHVADPEARANGAARLDAELPHSSESQFRDGVSDIFDELAAWFSHRKQSHNERLARKLADFVDRNILNRNLSLTLAADEAGISEAYASVLFKERVGETYGSYVERRRLELAQRLLREERRTVEDVAARVGYNSATAFRRAFKRRFGVPPSASRADIL